MKVFNILELFQRASSSVLDKTEDMVPIVCADPTKNRAIGRSGERTKGRRQRTMEHGCTLVQGPNGCIQKSVQIESPVSSLANIYIGSCRWQLRDSRIKRLKISEEAITRPPRIGLTISRKEVDSFLHRPFLYYAANWFLLKIYRGAFFKKYQNCCSFIRMCTSSRLIIIFFLFFLTREKNFNKFFLVE